MDAAHWHLVLTHRPVVGAVFASLLLVVALATVIATVPSSIPVITHVGTRRREPLGGRRRGPAHRPDACGQGHARGGGQ